MFCVKFWEDYHRALTHSIFALSPVTPGLSCDKVSLMRARNYLRLIVAHIPRPSLNAVAAVVLLNVFARLMLCPLWLPWLWTESRAGASFSM